MSHGEYKDNKIDINMAYSRCLHNLINNSVPKTMFNLENKKCQKCGKIIMPKENNLIAVQLNKNKNNNYNVALVSLVSLYDANFHLSINHIGRIIKMFNSEREFKIYQRKYREMYKKDIFYSTDEYLKNKIIEIADNLYGVKRIIYQN
jgi:hypothetical protein